MRSESESTTSSTVGLRVSAALELEEMLGILVDGLVVDMGVSAVRLWLISESRPTLAATGGASGAENAPDAIARLAEEGHEPVVTTPSTDGSWGPAHWILEHDFRSVIALPLVFGEERLGILALWLGKDEASRFDEGPRELGHFANTVAIAIRNCRRYAEMSFAARRLEAENRSLHDEVPGPVDCGGIVGRSPAIRRVLELIDQVASTDATVLIEGETGTGKELVARTIHERSRRKEGPLVKINCGAIASGLVESELFGHEKGAFTGALEKRIGRFELADGGTLFLDEVGELPPETQVKLLRALQEQEIERVGSSRAIRVNVRIIAAGNRDLAAEVEAGRFRSDLYYRLNVFPISIPPLRERRDDASMIAACALPVLARQIGKETEGLTAEARAVLDHYSWPGNVRELLNVLQRALITAPGPGLDASDFALAGIAEGPGSIPAGQESEDSSGSSTLTSLREMERRHITHVLEHTGWVIEGPGGAAVILDLHPNTLRSRMNRLGLRRPDRPTTTPRAAGAH